MEDPKKRETTHMGPLLKNLTAVERTFTARRGYNEKRRSFIVGKEATCSKDNKKREEKERGKERRTYIGPPITDVQAGATQRGTGEVRGGGNMVEI